MHHDRRDLRKTSGGFKSDGVAHGGDERRIGFRHLARRDAKVAGIYGGGGSFAGRTSDEQITFHANNNGTAAAYLAIAQWVYSQCKHMGRGSPIELPRPHPG
jgi:hypothetical protein